MTVKKGCAAQSNSIQLNTPRRLFCCGFSALSASLTNFTPGFLFFGTNTFQNRHITTEKLGQMLKNAGFEGNITSFQLLPQQRFGALAGVNLSQGSITNMPGFRGDPTFVSGVGSIKAKTISRHYGIAQPSMKCCKRPCTGAFVLRQLHTIICCDTRAFVNIEVRAPVMSR